MSRDLDDPNELVGQKRRRKIGGGTSQAASQLSSEQANKPAIEIAKELDIQQSSNSDDQQSNSLVGEQSNHLASQQVNCPIDQIVGNVDSLPASTLESQQSSNLTSQVANRVDSLPATMLASQQAKLPDSEVASMPDIQQSNKLASQKVGSKKGKKDDREQQALYLPAKQRQVLKLLAVLENRELSDIAEDAFNAYIEQSPFKSVLPGLLDAQQKGKNT